MLACLLPLGGLTQMAVIRMDGARVEGTRMVVGENMNATVGTY